MVINHGSITLTSTELSGSTMATTPDDQQPWIPYETTKDCTLGFCSIYCPQWCYIIFPPPPSLAGDASPSSVAAAASAFSPLVIALIGILAAAFLLVSYYTIVSKYCAFFDPLRRRARHHPPEADEPPPPEAAAAWHAFPSNGLDESLISKIAVYKYQPGEGVVDGADCSVCLGEFREDESLRLLPKCSHAFHLQCIDTWLRSHSSCPLCRANITAAPPPPPPPEPPAQTNDLPINLEDVGIGIEEEDGVLEGEFGNDPSKESPNCTIEIGDGGGGSSLGPIRRCSSVGSWRHDGRVSIADVLRISMEEEFLVAKDQGVWVGAGSSRWCGVEHGNGKGKGRSRSLHCVISPVSMKRSFSSGRNCFSGGVLGRGRNVVLPI